MRNGFSFAWPALTALFLTVSTSLTAQHRMPLVDSHVKINSTTLTGELGNGDFFGSGVCAIGDVDGDGVIDAAVGARLDDDGGTDRGAVYILFMNTDGTVSSYQKISDSQGSFGGTLTNQCYFGNSVAPLGDYDGNGVPDLIVGSSGDNDGGSGHGAVWLLMLNSSGNVIEEIKISDTADNFTATLGNSDGLGRGVANLGDVDGDGNTDLLVGALRDDDGATDAGAAYIMFLNAHGGANAVSGYQKIGNSSGGFSTTLGSADYFGTQVAAVGDVDGNGVPDAAIAAIFDDDGGTNRGAVYVLLLQSTGAGNVSVLSEEKIKDKLTDKIDVLSNTNQFGLGLAGAGDVDLDGLPDLIVGAYNAEALNEGACYLITLNADGSAKDFRKITETHGWDYTGLDQRDQFGKCVAPLGDLDGNGVTDFIVGATKDDDGGTDRGAVYVLLSDDQTLTATAGGFPLLAGWIEENEGGFTGTLDANDNFGSAIINIGDVDNDGHDDLAVGAANDDDGGTDRGAVYILFMDGNGAVDSYQKISDTQGSFTATIDNSDYFGNALAAPGDLDADGVPDLIVGVPYDDDGGTNHGAIYVLYLNTDGTVDTYQKISDTNGSFSATIDNDDRFGCSIATVGDLDGDGYADLVVGADGDDDDHTNSGAAYVLFLASDETVDSYHKINETSSDLLSTALSTNSFFGKTIVSLGDVDGDTFNDLGIYAELSAGSGSLFVLLMNSDGTVDVESRIGVSQLPGELANADYFGQGLAAPGDLNNDKIPDLIATAYGDDDGESAAGAFYTLLLNSDGTLGSYEKHSRTRGHLTTFQKVNDSYGNTAAWLGDLDGDGHGELAIGAKTHAPGVGEGLVYRYNFPTAYRINTDVYARLQKQLDGGYTYTRMCELSFAYAEDYEPLGAGELEYYIYDNNRSEQLSWNDQAVSIDHGDNRCTIDVSSLTHDYYILEVVNDKNERAFLRFRHDDTLGSCP